MYLKSVLSLVFLLNVIITPNSVSGRHLPHRVIKRSPQLTLTVADDEPTRSHPPTAEDLEERRQALVTSLAGFGGMGGNRLQGIAIPSLDVVGGALKNAGQLFAPLTNATRKATQGLPRLGNVINGLTDGARSYSRQVAGGLRGTADVLVNNSIRIVTAAGTRGSQVLGDVLKLIRTLLDKFTRAVTALAHSVSNGVLNVTKLGSQFLAKNSERARKVLSNPRLLEPAKNLISLGSNLARGLSSDFTDAQPLVTEKVRAKINLGNALIPRIGLASALSRMTVPESISLNSNAEGDSQNQDDETGSDLNEEKKISPVDILNLFEMNSEDKLDESESKGVKVESITTETSTSSTTSATAEISKTSTTSTTKEISTTPTTSTITEISTTPTASTTTEISTTPTTSKTTEISTTSTTESPKSNEVVDSSGESKNSPTTLVSSDTTESSAGFVSLPAKTVEELFGIATRLLSIEK